MFLLYLLFVIGSEKTTRSRIVFDLKASSCSATQSGRWTFVAVRRGDRRLRAHGLQSANSDGRSGRQHFGGFKRKYDHSLDIVRIRSREETYIGWAFCYGSVGDACRKIRQMPYGSKY